MYGTNNLIENYVAINIINYNYKNMKLEICIISEQGMIQYYAYNMSRNL